jgi:hypothetical protein
LINNNPSKNNQGLMFFSKGKVSLALIMATRIMRRTTKDSGSKKPINDMVGQQERGSTPLFIAA